jgi:coproporphyrinogen III oxidase
MLDKSTITDWFKNLQNQIIDALEIEDGKGKFIIDNWERLGGGGGITRPVSNGNIIEKGGVNFSAVYGPVPEFMIKNNEALSGQEFYATGVSIVLHPHNPMVPIIHMNVRYFEAGNTCWFGGGIDLTPHYINEADAKKFHLGLQHVCNQFDANYYTQFKQLADDYFYIPHRNETRGVGGIFFDFLKPNEEKSKEFLFQFVQAVGNSFAPFYTSIMRKNKNLIFGENEKQWQFLRRGRYAEFNLVYDRGTKFGLETNGRAESILMSLPPQAAWEYNFTPFENSPEFFTQLALKKGIDWTPQ